MFTRAACVLGLGVGKCTGCPFQCTGDTHMDFAFRIREVPSGLTQVQTAVGTRGRTQRSLHRLLRPDRQESPRVAEGNAGCPMTSEFWLNNSDLSEIHVYLGTLYLCSLCLGTLSRAVNLNDGASHAGYREQHPHSLVSTPSPVRKVPGNRDQGRPGPSRVPSSLPHVQAKVSSQSLGTCSVLETLVRRSSLSFSPSEGT